jgi:hypothetical protein
MFKNLRWQFPITFQYDDGELHIILRLPCWRQGTKIVPGITSKEIDHSSRIPNIRTEEEFINHFGKSDFSSKVTAEILRGDTPPLWIDRVEDK